MPTPYNRNTIKALALKLEEKYPETDLIALSNQELEKMIISVGEETRQGGVFAFSLKSAWAYIREKTEAQELPPDAYL